MKIEIATETEREKLTWMRAAQWKGGLSPEHYVERNKYLFRHPFGKLNIETRVLRDLNGNILTAMDALSIGMLVKKQSVTSERSFLIASVLTPEENRGKGYASFVLADFFQANAAVPAVLYSDISPRFYERYGFKVRPMLAVEEELFSTEAQVEAHPISLGKFSDSLKRQRIESLRNLEGVGGCVEPEPVFIDWHVERFRVFAKLAGKKLSENLFWSVEHKTGPHLLAAVPHYLYGRMEALWMDSDCGDCRAFLSDLAGKHGFEKIYYWTEHLTRATGRGEQPMIRIPTVETAFFDNPQYLDSW